ncbi:YybH family protein [Aurantiacibacter hainanensis]|uniref:YybH family protein n=1 Tax=Aurantiacibacter hainanensis TaxID=3076114 RepID=UPI0030C743A7
MARGPIATMVAAILLGACTGGAEPDDVVDTVRQTEQSQLQAIASDDVVGIARLYADDARLVRPDGTVLQGGAEIGAEYAALVEDPNFALTIEPTHGWASSGDDLAVLTSLVEFTTSDPETGEPTTLPMTSQTVWTKAPGGTWMIRSAYNVAQDDTQVPATQPDLAAAE